MIEEKDILKHFSMYMRSNSIESGPPLSTILGNCGVNKTKFCNEFNDFTKELPNYFLIKVDIIVYNDKTFTFFLNKPSSSFLLRIMSYKKEYFFNRSGGLKLETFDMIQLSDIFLICNFIYGNVDDNNLKSIIGTVSSMNLLIDEEEKEEEDEKNEDTE